jgi:hypothetical protein
VMSLAVSARLSRLLFSFSVSPVMSSSSPTGLQAINHSIYSSGSRIRHSRLLMTYSAFTNQLKPVQVLEAFLSTFLCYREDIALDLNLKIQINELLTTPVPVLIFPG